MKALVAFLSTAFLLRASLASSTSPVSKVMQMLTDLEAKINKEGKDAEITYAKFAAWCEGRSRNIGFEIKSGKAQVEDLNAAIEKSSADATAFSTKIEELSASIASDEADLKDATAVRETEAADYDAASKELHDVINTLERAISILERDISKGGAAMVQLEKANSVVEALTIMLQASAISSADASRLTALVQSNDPDESWGAPAAKVYVSHSGGILDTLNGLLEKAQGQLESTTKKEMNAKHNFDMLKQSLTDEMKFGNKEMSEAKKNLAQAQQDEATAKGDLAVTSADLKGDLETKNTLKYDCMTKSTDYESAMKSRTAELEALAAAKKAISSMTDSATSLTYGLNQVSFVQLGQDSNIRIASGMDLANFEAVRFVRDLARKENAPALAQLANRMASAIRFATDAGQDPFAKVKGLIHDMIKTLEQDAKGDATHKAYCDEQIGETMTKKQEATAELEKLNTKIDMATTRSAKLKSEVADLQKELAELASSQAEMNKVRMEEKSAYRANEKDMQQGLEGVKMALDILRDYYAKEPAHDAAVGSGTGIIALLEVVESDFHKGLAEMTAEEDAAQNEYDATTKENEITTATKDKDVQYKTKESLDLDKTVSELRSDKEGVTDQLTAVTDYLKSLDKNCVDQGQTYDERKAHREAEIAGLKEALKILQGEAALIQQKWSLRGVSAHKDPQGAIKFQW